MKKRLILLLTVMSLLVTLFVPAFAAETEETTEATEETAETAEETTEATEAETVWVDDIIGDNLTWSLDGSTLTVTGSGEMYDCTGGAPWEADKDRIASVVFTGGVTYVGAEAFMDCENLESVDFGGAMYAIGPDAFRNCTGLTTISLPATFRRFYESCFQGCSNLGKIYCTGPMPNFRSNCLWTGDYITIYTAVNNPWPQEYVEQLVNNFSGRLYVVTGSGDSYYEYTEPTEASTEVPTTEAPTEPTTVPTEAPTEAPTEPTTAPTEAPTEAPVTVPTEAPTQAPTKEPDPVDEILEDEDTGRTLMYVLMGIVGLTGLLAAALIVRSITHKGGRYSD